jgi:ABC-type multidrug transport system fused ATPase/permease subunit
MMSYALQITQMLNSLVQVGVNVETNIVSVERVAQYIDLPSEAGGERPDGHPRAGWPEKGEIVFDRFSTRYHEGLDEVLRDVHLKIKPGENVGVVGRTGAGKSSLALALSVPLPAVVIFGFPV